MQGTKTRQKGIILVEQCPKCGHAPKWNEVFGRYWLICSNCGFQSRKDMDFKKVIQAWNVMPKEYAK